MTIHTNALLKNGCLQLAGSPSKIGPARKLGDFDNMNMPDDSDRHRTRISWF